jgi:Methyltransferase domain
MNRCRNCDAVAIRELGFIGALAPFFLKRVVGAELITRYSARPLKRSIQGLTSIVHRLVARIHPQSVAVELQSCLNCSFVQTKFPFSDEAIGRLYEDYRSDSYNKERSHYEPTYAAVANSIGSHTEAGLDRVEALTSWLDGKINLNEGTMLDFGGADGKFLPAFHGPKYVYEISDIQPAPGIMRIAGESSLQTYSYVQLAHVLEHVTEPLKLARRVAALVQEGGYLLIEVPQDVSTEILQQLQLGDAQRIFTVHEHINYYGALSLRKLMEAVDLEVVAIDAVPIESSMGRQTFIRGLARRSSAR